MKEVERRRLEKYLDKLASKEKDVNPSLARVTNNDIRFSFLSLIIIIGDEVWLRSNKDYIGHDLQL